MILTAAMILNAAAPVSAWADETTTDDPGRTAVNEEAVDAPVPDSTSDANDFADALSVGSLAYLYKAPVVLVNNNHFDKAAAFEKNYNSCLVMGGTGLISDTTVSRIIQTK